MVENPIFKKAQLRCFVFRALLLGLLVVKNNLKFKFKKAQYVASWVLGLIVLLLGKDSVNFTKSCNRLANTVW